VLATNSLRFRQSASAYLSRTPTVNGTRTTWTWSAWVKRGTLGSQVWLFGAGGTSNPREGLNFDGNNNLNVASNTGGSPTYELISTAVYRDPSAWYHIVYAFDSTQATASNRIKLYVNGVQITAFGTATYPSQNANAQFINSTSTQIIGGLPNTGIFDGYMADINFVDGQALEPNSFGTLNGLGIWQPIRYGGSYGTNGFYLPFTNTTSTTTLGYDFSPQGNNWTTNNISLTAGSTYDSMTDVPTLTSATTANYSVLNPVSNLGNGSITAGNLNFVATSFGWVSAAGTMFLSSGKWYYEVTLTTFDSGPGAMIGVCNTGFTAFNSYGGSTANSWTVQASASTTNKWNNNSATLLATETSVAGDIFMVAYDVDASKVWFGRNGTWYGSGDPAAGTNAAFTNLTGTLGVVVSSISTTSAIAVNCGQRPFSYTPPTGFIRLNTFNLPTPTIGATPATTANKYFDVTLYTGTGSSLSITNSGSMQPDFVWIKNRSSATYHWLTNAITGTAKQLTSNASDAESSYTQILTAFNSNGFTVGTDGDVNANGSSYVGWQWKANGSGSTNTAGSITSTVSANTTSGFSIVKINASGSSGSIGHGLGVAPSMIIGKNTAGADDWYTYHASIGTGAFIRLNTSGAQASSASAYTNINSTTFTAGSGVLSNNAHIFYCFAQVAGYSAFGSYTGNGSTDGPFIFTGFRPKYWLIKRTDSADFWVTDNSVASPYNLTSKYLLPNTADAEGDTGSNPAGQAMDVLSNGFKLRNTNSGRNASGGTYIYIAFAENPFKYANAR
jgi:hypothetical protein